MRNVLIFCALSWMIAGCGESQVTVSETVEPDAASDKVFDIPYLMEELDNGLRVIIVKTDYPDIVAVQVPVQTGSRNEVEPGKSGFAHFFEHMMFRGTDKFPADVYNGIIKKAGADTNAFTTDDFTNYFEIFTKPDLEKIIEVEGDRFQNLKYTEDKFRTEALAVKGEYLKNFSDPTSKAFERIRDLSYTVHTYKHTTMGFIADINAMPDQMEYSRTFFDRWYRPEKTSVIIVGDVDPQKTLAMVKKYWGGWKRGNYTAKIPVEPPLAGPIFEHLKMDAPTQSWLMLSFRGPAFVPTENAMPALAVLSSIYLSESSDLYKKLVIEEQWVDQLWDYFPARKDPGVLLIAARLIDDSKAADVEAAIYDALARARTELVSADKLDKTKKRLRYSFTSSLDNSAAISAMLAQIVQYDRTPETVNETYRTYDALTPADIRQYADEYFTDSNRVTFTLSNSDGLAGVDGEKSLDAVTKIKASAMEASADSAQGSVTEESELEASGVVAEAEAVANPVPVAIIAQQSKSAPLVDVAYIFHVGAAMDPKGKKGLAALTAAMLTGAGSTLRTTQEINDALYPMAAGFGAQVDKEMTRLSGQVHKDNLEQWYALTSGQLLDPGWRESDFIRLKTQLINGVRTELVGNNDEELGKEVLYNAIYGDDHPYGTYNLGRSADLGAITLDDVKAFYKQYYTINNLTLGLGGGYTDGFATKVANDLQKLPAGGKVALKVPAASSPNGAQALIVEKDTPAVAVSFGFPISVKRGDPDWVALWLATSWLGEHRNSTGQLYDRIREARGMNYGDYAYIEYFPRGMFLMKPDTNLGRQEQIFQVWIRPLRSNADAQFATRTAYFEIEKLLEDGISESDFEATRSYLSKNASLLEGTQSRRLGYAFDSQYYGTDDFASYVRAGLASLTLADVNRVLRENLNTQNMQYVFVTKDAKDLKQRLLGNKSSPMTYAADMPRELLEEDKSIQDLSLDFKPGSVKIIPAEQVFK